MRLWTIEEPSLFRGPDNLLIPGNAYSAEDLGFGGGENRKEIVLYVEGINQLGAQPFAPQPSTIHVEVSFAEETLRDSVRLTIVEGNLGTNNSSHEPFEDEFTGFGSLRPGVPDVEFLVDRYDEIVEDQGDGFTFWRRANLSGERRPIDVIPIVIDVPVSLRDSGFDFFLRVDDEEEGFKVQQNPSSEEDHIEFLTNGFLNSVVKLEMAVNSEPLWRWKLRNSRIGGRAGYLVMPDFIGDPSREHVVTLKLVGRDRMKNETVVDSIKLTLKPMTWSSGQAYNDVFWMGSARGEPSGSYHYPADFVDGNRVSQDIPIYPQFSWISGPDPDDQKENVLVYIHGFNINPDQAFRDSAEVYKRLWWSGYRGNFVSLTWHGDEWDPLNHVCDSLPDRYSLLCVARFFPNMENALQTSPRLRQFLYETVLGDWEAESENVYLMVHSLGNLLTLDALRLHAIQSNDKLIRHMIAVEAAVWQETLWDQGPVTISTNLSLSEADLLKGSWAFWFNQNESPVSESFDFLFNSFTRKDGALVAMKVNDYLPILGTQCTYPTIPGPPVGPCPRIERGFGRGIGEHYRVPVADGFQVADANRVAEPDNRPDLAYEIPAMLNPALPTGIRFPWDDLTNPLGMEEIPENSATNMENIDTIDLAWPDSEHSWFLEGDFWEVWPWFEFLTREDEQNRMIIPSGKE